MKREYENALVEIINDKNIYNRLKDLCGVSKDDLIYDTDGFKSIFYQFLLSNEDVNILASLVPVSEFKEGIIEQLDDVSDMGESMFPKVRSINPPLHAFKIPNEGKITFDGKLLTIGSTIYSSDNWDKIVKAITTFKENDNIADSKRIYQAIGLEVEKNIKKGIICIILGKKEIQALKSLSKPTDRFILYKDTDFPIIDKGSESEIRILS